jgi:4-hydroxybenzoate polyprenyltransferase
MMVREYMKLARSFNAALTGVSPVMGAIAMGQYNLVLLILLFLIGFLGHAYGFVFNDIIDYKIDKYSKEIQDRPLVSGTISMKKASAFTLLSMFIAFLIALSIAVRDSNYYPLLLLAASAFFITLYDLISKKYPFMDVLVSIGIFFLVLYGAATTVDSIFRITLLAWIVGILGFIQVLYMQIVAGGMKDIENDYEKGAKTTAIQLGVRITNGVLRISMKFKTLAYVIQLADIALVLLPFFIIWRVENPSLLQYFQWIAILFIGVVMLVLSMRLLTMERFKRAKARKLIGSHYVINFALVPIMLMNLNLWAGLLVFFPALGFILSNIVLHETILQPKNM